MIAQATPDLVPLMPPDGWGLFRVSFTAQGTVKDTGTEYA
jgi:hypothetical protein